MVTVEQLDAFDFSAADWDHGGSLNPSCVRESASMLKHLVANPGVYEATTDGGWPRCGWGEVLDVEIRGEVAGPDRRIMPRFLLASWAGGSWHPWYMLSDIRPRPVRAARKEDGR